MTMNGPEPKTTEKSPTTTPTRGESAVRHLWKRATEEDRKEDADLIATIAKLLMPAIKLSAGLPVAEPKTDPKKATVNSAEIDGTEVDLSGMADSDAEAYRQYAAEMDGSAALERHVARLEEEDAEMRRIGAFHDGS